MKRIFTLSLGLLISGLALAQTGYKIGAKVADFTLKNTKDQAMSLSQFKDAQVVVVVFTSKNCPYAKLYDGRLQTLANTYAGKGVKFIYVNPAIGLEEGGDTIKELSEQVDTSVSAMPYLLDNQQKVSKQFGAVKTPEVFVLQNSPDGFYLKYKGAIDDNPQVEAYAKEFYLKNALENALAGRPVTTAEIRPTGCMIKKF
ncbi:redoxin domain-containing protein [Nibribacter ruber]|uniref:Redoxin domain-containing protein n=1 Tax=Nibribacter ruber TaxID=2698458 RepID=A0A6P1P386_9BACT|nr:redoxin domain-containing protein [Nibribacter ruber]QHL88859.1 redoxin domain-containing protein [Nibribacter ruber]